MKNFVDYKWLMENMDKDNLIILDARAGLKDPEEGLNAYKKGHIKGAQFVSLEEIMTGKVSTYGGRHPLPDLKEFTDHMMNLGVDDDSIVIIYDDGNIAMAGRLWWLLKYIGKEDVFILEGGISKWMDNNGEITTKVPKINRSNSLSLNINKRMNVDMEYVKNATNSSTIAIVDARAYERYIGEVEPLDKIAGHIPKALNYPWMDLVKDGEIISLERLRDKFKSLNEYDEVIVHCGSGITGTVNYILMDEIGLSPRLYSGGYSDWISYEDNPVVTKDIL